MITTKSAKAIYRMKRTKKKTDKKQLELFLMKVAENADNTLREYLQECGGEHSLYVAEYMQRRSYLLE